MDRSSAAQGQDDTLGVVWDVPSPERTDQETRSAATAPEWPDYLYETLEDAANAIAERVEERGLARLVDELTTALVMSA